MASRPVTVTSAPTTAPSIATRQTLFRTALSVATIGSILVSVILFLHAGLALGRLRYFIDIGHHPLHITSAFLLAVGFLSILAFILLNVGSINTNRTFVLAAAGLLIFSSLTLIVLSIWSFVTILSGQLPKSINSTLVKELDQTQYNIVAGNHIIVDNTLKMARLEKQHQCCGLSDSIEDYRSRHPSFYASQSSSSSSSGGSNTKGKITNPQKSPTNAGGYPLLPISCCNEKYRSSQNNLCSDVYGNTTNPMARYNLDGCFSVIVKEKFQRIQQQGFVTIVAATLGVISSIALATVIRLFGEGFRVVPLRTTTITTTTT
ncbi:unnamed protein product [Adineta ricciae]|uniref:Tetraspanin n=1 Tax=Adineta ricciae TaxID=249248 RepID=A0A814L3P7_ADIRI|nr:unnamed protein product [Adineta ricciae]CAF1059019.1 unnamed protein product [Adineta ricciae]